jgi:hypothetical protein
MSEKRLTNVTYPHGCVIVSCVNKVEPPATAVEGDGWAHVVIRNGKCLGESLSYGEALAVAREANKPPVVEVPDELPAFLNPAE